MILLRDILREIAFGGITPYALQAPWHRTHRRGDWEASIDADGVAVRMYMTLGEHNEWYFAYTMPDVGGGRTMTHAKSVGGVNYLRLIRTVGEAILDFCDAHAPEAVCVTGADADDRKESQKTRIYAAFLTDNQARILSAGYVSRWQRDELWLVRTSSADTTGIEND